MENNSIASTIVQKSKMMLISLVVILSSIAILFVYIGNQLQQSILETIIKEEKKVALVIYKQTFKNFIDKYESIASHLLINKDIITAFENKQRDKLLQLTLPIYKKLQQDNPYLQIMHFHTPETRSFLRVHKPQKYGDDLSSVRHMINKVNQSKVKETGIEVGRYGIYYRVALPILNQNKDFLGVFELGINIDYILDILKNEYNFDTLLLFKKDIFEIIFKSYHGVKYEAYSDDFYLITSKYDNNKLENKNGDHVTFKVHTIKDNAEQKIGEILFVKNLEAYTKNIEQLINFAVVISIFFVLIAFYILKSIFDNYLKVISSYQEKLEIKNKSLFKLSNIDHLTQINNRKSIETKLKSELERVARYKNPFSLIIFDVDNFKNINDKLGHNIGDKVLKGISKLVSSNLRRTDHFGRWGGEEFLILLPETSLEDAYVLAELIREKIYSHDFKDIQNVSCSFGIADCSDCLTSDEIIHNADTALYEAKETGKNKVIMFKDLKS